MSDREDFKNLILSHAKIMNKTREELASRIASIVAASGQEPLRPVDITIAMARIDDILDEFYEPEKGRFRNIISSESARARKLAYDQSNAILEENLKDHPDLLSKNRLQ